MTWQSILILAAAGATVGSFATNLGMRVTSKRAWASGRSRCDHCDKTLSYAETIPVLSYVGMRGRCGGCTRPISPMHLLGEITGAGLLPTFLILYSWMAGLMAFGAAMSMVAAAVVGLSMARRHE